MSSRGPVSCHGNLNANGAQRSSSLQAKQVKLIEVDGRHLLIGSKRSLQSLRNQRLFLCALPFAMFGGDISVFPSLSLSVKTIHFLLPAEGIASPLLSLRQCAPDRERVHCAELEENGMRQSVLRLLIRYEIFSRVSRQTLENRQQVVDGAAATLMSVASILPLPLPSAETQWSILTHGPAVILYNSSFPFKAMAPKTNSLLLIRN